MRARGPGHMNNDMLRRKWFKCCVRLATPFNTSHVARCCVEKLRAFGQAFKGKVTILNVGSSFSYESGINGSRRCALYPPFPCQCFVLRVFKAIATLIRVKSKKTLQSPGIELGTSCSESRALTNWATPAPITFTWRCHCNCNCTAKCLLTLLHDPFT